MGHQIQYHTVGSLMGAGDEFQMKGALVTPQLGVTTYQALPVAAAAMKPSQFTPKPLAEMMARQQQQQAKMSAASRQAYSCGSAPAAAVMGQGNTYEQKLLSEQHQMMASGVQMARREVMGRAPQDALEPSLEESMAEAEAQSQFMQSMMLDENERKMIQAARLSNRLPKGSFATPEEEALKRQLRRTAHERAVECPDEAVAYASVMSAAVPNLRKVLQARNRVGTTMRDAQVNYRFMNVNPLHYLMPPRAVPSIGACSAKNPFMSVAGKTQFIMEKLGPEAWADPPNFPVTFNGLTPDQMLDAQLALKLQMQ